MNHSI